MSWGDCRKTSDSSAVNCKYNLTKPKLTYLLSYVTLTPEDELWSEVNANVCLPIALTQCLTSSLWDIPLGNHIKYFLVNITIVLVFTMCSFVSYQLYGALLRQLSSKLTMLSSFATPVMSESLTIENASSLEKPIKLNEVKYCDLFAEFSNKLWSNAPNYWTPSPETHELFIRLHFNTVFTNFLLNSCSALSSRPLVYYIFG